MPQEDIFGQIAVPQGVEQFNAAAGGGESIGLLLFISNMIKIGTVVAGVWVMLNFVLAGYDYITSGDSKGVGAAKDRITMSVIGLVIIVMAYTLAGLVGLILFGRADYILNPQICGPDGCGTTGAGATQ